MMPNRIKKDIKKFKNIREQNRNIEFQIQNVLIANKILKFNLIMPCDILNLHITPSIKLIFNSHKNKNIREVIKKIRHELIPLDWNFKIAFWEDIPI